MPEIDLTPFLAEPITITIRAEKYVFPAELDMPDLIRAYELNRQLRAEPIYQMENGKPKLDPKTKKPLVDVQATDDKDAESIEIIHGFLLGIAQSAGTTATQLKMPPSMLSRLFGVLLVGSPEVGDIESILLEMITGKTKEERAEQDPTKKTGPKRAESRSGKRSPARSTS